MWKVRAETPANCEAIHHLTIRAFANMPYSQKDEQQMISRLRSRARLVLSNVVENEGEIVGHVAFSPMSDSKWLALGPISVAPELWGKGVGTALITASLRQLQGGGALGVALIGDPAYYSRFGFVARPEFAPPDEPADLFQILKFSIADPSKPLRFDASFFR